MGFLNYKRDFRFTIHQIALDTSFSVIPYCYALQHMIQYYKIKVKPRINSILYLNNRTETHVKPNEK